MNLTIFLFPLYFILIILPGETIIQLCFLKKKEKILQYSIIEHFIYLVVIGLSISSAISLFLALFQNLNIFSLILFDFGIFLISILLNKFNKKSTKRYLLIFRIINYFKSKESISFYKFVKKFYLSIISAIIFFIVFFFILINHRYILNQDTWRFTEWAIDIVKYNPNIFYSHETIGWYLGDILYTNFFNYYLATFILIDIESWHFIIQIVIPIITLICLFIFITNLKILRTDKKKYIPIILLFSSYFLFNWFFYSLPSTFCIILGLLLVNTTFDEEKRSYFLIIFLIIFMYLFHITTILLFAISYFFSIVIIRLINLFSKEKLSDFNKFLKKYLPLIIISLVIITIGAILFFFNYNEQIFDFLENRQEQLIDYEIRTATPAHENWIASNVGILVIFFCIFSILFIYPMIFNKKYKLMKNYENLDYKNKIPLFFWIFLIEIILISSFLPTWYLITGIPYMFYRYFIYLDLACIILFPFSFRYFLKFIERLKISKRRKKKYKISFESIFLTFSIILIGMHWKSGFNLLTHYQYIPEEHLDIYYWLKDNTPSDSIYFASPYTRCSVLYQHSILDDRIFISTSMGEDIFNDSLYNGYDNNYFRFLRRIFINYKPIDYRWAYTNSISEDFTYKKVDYIIIDDYYNNNLTKLMLKDTDLFEVIKKKTYYERQFYENYTIYVFCVNNNYNYFNNGGFERESDIEWALRSDFTSDEGNISISDLDPYEGNYSLIYKIFNKTGDIFMWSPFFIINANLNYSFSCYIKYIPLENGDNPIDLRFSINFYDSNVDFLSYERYLTQKDFNNSDTYSFFNYSFTPDKNAHVCSLEIRLINKYIKTTAITIDNVFLKYI